MLKPNFSKHREKEKPKKSARERAYSYPSLRTSSNRAFATRSDEIDRSIDRQRQLHAGLIVVPRDTTRRRRKKERKKRQLLCCCFTPKSSTKKNDVSQGVLRRCSTRKRRDARTQIFSLAHFAAARCGLSLFTSWYARFTSSYFLSNASFFFVAVMSKNEFFKKEKKGEVFI